MSSQTTAVFQGTAEQKEALLALIAEYQGQPGAVMPVLQKAQDIYGYLPIEVQNEIAEGLNISLAEIYGVVTFYSQFSLKPKGKYVIGVCMGTACYVKNAQAVLDRCKKELGIEVGECTQDNLFSIQDTRCLGCCGLAPVMMINDDVYGRLVPEDIPGILAKYKQ